MTDLGDKAREDFFSEAQEIIESLSRDLLLLDSSARLGAVDPELVNAPCTRSRGFQVCSMPRAWDRYRTNWRTCLTI